MEVKMESGNNEKFEFTGFEPDRALRTAVTRAFDMILGNAPSDARPSEAFIEKTAEGFKGTIRLISQQGIFLAEVIGRDPRETLERMSTRIGEQIGKWRSKRHLVGSLQIA
jgi:hypothetical protein